MIGIRLKIVGITASDRGRSCRQHKTCGDLVKEGTVLRLQHVTINIDGEEEEAIEAVEADQGCRVGFTRRHLIKHASIYDGDQMRWMHNNLK